MGEIETLRRAPQRLKVFEFIRQEVKAGRKFPSKRQIADHMGWKNESGASDCLHTLAGLDKVLDRKWHGRSAEFTLNADYI